MQSAMSIHSPSFYKLNCLIPINKNTKTADFALRDFLFLHFRRRAASANTPSRDRNAPRTDRPSSDCAATPLHAKPNARPHSHAFPCTIFLLSKQRLALPYPEPPPFFRASTFRARPPPPQRNSPVTRPHRCRASHMPTPPALSHCLVCLRLPGGCFRTSTVAVADQKTRRRRNSDLYLRRRAEMLNFIGNRVISHAIPETFSLIRQEL